MKLSKIQIDTLKKPCPNCGAAAPWGHEVPNNDDTEMYLWCDSCDLSMDSGGGLHCMKLYATLESSRGKIASLADNEQVRAVFTNGNIRIFEITFRDDGHKRGTLEILNLRDASTQVVEY